MYRISCSNRHGDMLKLHASKPLRSFFNSLFLIFNNYLQLRLDLSFTLMLSDTDAVDQ